MSFLKNIVKDYVWFMLSTYRYESNFRIWKADVILLILQPNLFIVLFKIVQSISNIDEIIMADMKRRMSEELRKLNVHKVAFVEGLKAELGAVMNKSRSKKIQSTKIKDIELCALAVREKNETESSEIRVMFSALIEESRYPNDKDGIISSLKSLLIEYYGRVIVDHTAKSIAFHDSEFEFINMMWAILLVT